MSHALNALVLLACDTRRGEWVSLRAMHQRIQAPVADIQRVQQCPRPSAGHVVRLARQHRQQSDVVGDVQKGNQVRCLKNKACRKSGRSTMVM